MPHFITQRLTLLAATVGLAASWLSPVVLASPPALKVGVGRIVPMSYFDEHGTAVGFAVDVMNEAARREHLSLTWVRITKSVKEDLQSGTIDLLSAGMATEERKQLFYVSEPWWSEELALLSRAGTAQPVKRLGVQQVYIEFARPYFNPATFVHDLNWRTDSADVEARAVCKGMLDAALITHGELHDLFLNRPEDCNGVRLQSADTAITYDLSLISRKSDEAVAKRLRKRIDDLVLDGTLLQAVRAHPPIAISGAVHLEERLRERYHNRMWLSAALISVLLIAILLWFLWNRQRTLTRLNKLHDELRNAHARSTLKHEVARIGSYEWFAEPDRMEWSPELEAIYGRTICTMDEWKTHVHPDDLEPLLIAVDLAARNQQIHLDTTFRIIRADGEVVWIHSRGKYQYDAGGRAVHMLAVNMDVTELKQVEGALSQANAQLEALFDSVPEPMMVTDEDGNVLRTNAAFRSSILYKTNIDAYLPHVELFREDGQLVPPELWPINRVRRGEKVAATDFILSIDGSRSNRRYSGNPVFDNCGKVTHAVVLFSDISDLKKGQVAQQILSDLLQVCSSCRRIHDGETEDWYSMEGYLRLHTAAKFSHGMCPDCSKQWFSEVPHSTNGNQGKVRIS